MHIFSTKIYNTHNAATMLIIIELFFQMQMILMHMMWIIYMCCIEMLMVDMKIDKIMWSKFWFIFDMK